MCLTSVMMDRSGRARFEMINDRLEPDEEILFDVLALLLDPGGGLKAREAEGHLLLSDRRLIFGTPEHGILVDVATSQIELPVRTESRLLMAHVLVSLKDGSSHRLVINKRSARAMAGSINRVV